MQQKTKDKLLLCLQEMSWVKEILDEKHASNLMAHILGIYAAVRMDDFIHLLPNYSTPNDKAEYIGAHSQGYTDRLKSARDKLGAHFQTVVKEEICVTADGEERKSDFIERNRIFQGIDYCVITEEIENAIIVYQIATETEDTEPPLVKMEARDRQKLSDICKKTNFDGAAVVSTDILNISRPNAICLITGSKAQQKAQQLLSIEQMVDDIKQLYEGTYHAAGLKRMFKRMMVCWILNYYDNLVTRPVAPTALQYDPGFDELAVKMFEKEALTAETEACKDYYAKLHGLKDATAILDEARRVRNKTCGHLDGAMEEVDINAMVDNYDMSPFLDLYGKWVQTFHEVLNLHVMLSHLYLPFNTVYDVQIEETGSKYFYGNEVQPDTAMFQTCSLSVSEAMNAISKGEQDKNYALASEKIIKLIHNAKGGEYQELKKRLKEKYKTDVTWEELSFYCNALRMASHGFPDKNMALIIDHWECLKNCQKEAHFGLLIPLVWNARFDKEGKLKRVLDELCHSNEEVHQVFGGLAMMFAYYRKDCGPYAYSDNPVFNKDVENYVQGISDNALRLSLTLSLASFWFTDELYHKTWKNYSDSLMELARNAFEQYCNDITVEKDDYDMLKKLLEEKRFVELTWYLIKSERQMNRKVTCFESLVRNGQIRGYLTWSEKAYWALCQEEVGNVAEADKLLARMVGEGLYNKGLYLSYCKFLGRHSEFSDKRGAVLAETEKMFSLTEEDKEWISK